MCERMYASTDKKSMARDGENFPEFSKLFRETRSIKISKPNPQF